MLTFDEAVDIVYKLQMTKEGNQSKFSHTHCLCVEINANKKLLEFLKVQALLMVMKQDLGYAVLILETGIAIGMEMEKQRDAIG